MDSRYEFYFSNRLHDNMPSVWEWYFISNIDYLLFDYKSKRFIIIELKTRLNQLTKWQRLMYNLLHKRFIYSNWIDWYMYMWTYLVSFNWDNFSDWNVYLEWSKIQKQKVTEEDLIYFITKLLRRWQYM